MDNTLYSYSEGIKQGKKTVEAAKEKTDNVHFCKFLATLPLP